MKPILITETEHTLDDLEKVEQENNVWRKIDTYPNQLEELFNIENPQLKFDPGYQDLLAKYLEEKNRPGRLNGTWVYYPWNGYLVHILNQKEYEKVRTNRNQNIINSEEQKKLKDFNVGVLGLSIGNGMALNLAYSGISNHMKLADFDTLSLSNLNRVRSGVHELGKEKSKITAEQIYEVNPYAELELFGKGLNDENIEEFVAGSKKLNLIFEAIDDFEQKIKIRMVARKYGVPVIMLTNLGDRLLIDVERYDKDPNTEIFNGLTGATAEEVLSKPISENDRQKFALAIVGRENVPTRVIETIGEINKTLVGRPQVMSTVTVGGGVAAYLARKICLDQKLDSGRKLIRFEELV